MRRILTIMMLAAVCCTCLVSCNEKPKKYKFVKVAANGKEEAEEIVAGSDTAALKMYFERLEQVILANIDKQQAPYEAMYIISPEGDTLNTDEELLNSVAASLPVVGQATTPATEVPLQPADPAKDH